MEQFLDMLLNIRKSDNYEAIGVDERRSMERNGVGMISLHYSAQDYLDINLSVTSTEEDSLKSQRNVFP